MGIFNPSDAPSILSHELVEQILGDYSLTDEDLVYIIITLAHWLREYRS